MVRAVRRALVMLALGGVALVASACGGYGSGGGAGADVDIDITLKDFSIAASPSSASAGELTFSATNDGPSIHEFEILTVPAGVDADALPVSSEVADTEGLTLVDEVEDIAPGTSAELTVSLEPGMYAVICNLPGHYEQGMHTTLVVE